MLPQKLDTEVVEDLAGIVEWYEQQRVGLGDEFLETFWATLDRIAEFPLSHHRHSTGLRYSLMNRFPYWIIYEAHPTHVLIAAVIHTARGEDYRDSRLSR